MAKDTWRQNAQGKWFYEHHVDGNFGFHLEKKFDGKVIVKVRSAGTIYAPGLTFGPGFTIEKNFVDIPSVGSDILIICDSAGEEEPTIEFYDM